MRVAAALGADLHARPYPGTGPADSRPAPGRHGRAAARRAPSTVACDAGGRRPAPGRGFIDVVLSDMREPAVVATELESDLRRIEQLLRWSQEKAASLPSSDGWPSWSGDRVVGCLATARRASHAGQPRDRRRCPAAASGRVSRRPRRCPCLAAGYGAVAGCSADLGAARCDPTTPEHMSACVARKILTRGGTDRARHARNRGNSSASDRRSGASDVHAAHVSVDRDRELCVGRTPAGSGRGRSACRG